MEIVNTVLSTIAGTGWRSLISAAQSASISLSAAVTSDLSSLYSACSSGDSKNLSATAPPASAACIAVSNIPSFYRTAEQLNPYENTVRKRVGILNPYMIETIDWKFVAAMLGLLSNIAFLPYLIDIFKRRTEPHVYTWLIWLITQGTATVGVYYGGGGWGAAGLTLGTVLVAVVFLLSFRYGTKNITKSDTLVLIAALAAVLVWWQLNQPVLAVLMVSAIDALGYIPTYRKSWSEPWSETASSWGIFAAGNFISLFGLAALNLLTVTYLATIMVANTILLTLILIRRRKISKPS